MADSAASAATHEGETPSRRDFIFIATGAAAAVGAAVTAWPFIDQMNPATDTRALSTTEFDLSPLRAGQQVKVMWQGKPVFVRYRTPAEIASAERDDFAVLRDPATDESRL